MFAALLQDRAKGRSRRLRSERCAHTEWTLGRRNRSLTRYRHGIMVGGVASRGHSDIAGERLTRGRIHRHRTRHYISLSERSAQRRHSVSIITRRQSLYGTGGCHDRGRAADRRRIAWKRGFLARTRTRWCRMGLLKYFTGRIEVAQFVRLSLGTAYPNPFISRATVLCSDTSITRPFPQPSSLPLRIFEIIIILSKPRQWRCDDAFDCAQK
jgi:hypothetical protein